MVKISALIVGVTRQPSCPLSHYNVAPRDIWAPLPESSGEFWVHLCLSQVQDCLAIYEHLAKVWAIMSVTAGYLFTVCEKQSRDVYVLSCLGWMCKKPLLIGQGILNKSIRVFIRWTHIITLMKNKKMMIVFTKAIEYGILRKSHIFIYVVIFLCWHPANICKYDALFCKF